ncbi:hypothetical protein DAEQUDRAFT_152876 [Daedalea quercina L-15889]|uniref:Uncharacterized protein n=1 Tax=Daedalea quercina L-15889 TaxID=1314783 RepID=A0A165RLY4_9APHY|nr:hypothetical protein DAEQUDRAFT_152876 [Daedalea quercina L-15889]
MRACTSGMRCDDSLYSSRCQCGLSRADDQKYIDDPPNTSDALARVPPPGPVVVRRTRRRDAWSVRAKTGRPCSEGASPERASPATSGRLPSCRLHSPRRTTLDQKEGRGSTIGYGRSCYALEAVATADLNDEAVLVGAASHGCTIAERRVSRPAERAGLGDGRTKVRPRTSGDSQCLARANRAWPMHRIKLSRTTRTAALPEPALREPRTSMPVASSSAALAKYIVRSRPMKRVGLRVAAKERTREPRFGHGRSLRDGTSCAGTHAATGTGRTQATRGREGRAPCDCQCRVDSGNRKGALSLSRARSSSGGRRARSQARQQATSRGIPKYRCSGQPAVRGEGGGTA